MLIFFLVTRIFHCTFQTHQKLTTVLKGTFLHKKKEATKLIIRSHVQFS